METNDLLFAITYEGKNIYFSFSHNFCGAMRWIKATLWQYLTDLGIDIDDAGIVMPDTPFTPEETAAPDVQSFFYRFLIQSMLMNIKPIKNPSDKTFWPYSLIARACRIPRLCYTLLRRGRGSRLFLVQYFIEISVAFETGFWYNLLVSLCSCAGVKNPRWQAGT